MFDNLAEQKVSTMRALAIHNGKNVALLLLAACITSFTTLSNNGNTSSAEACTAFQTSGIMGTPWLMLGYLPGKEVPDIKLLSPDGEAFQLHHELKARKKPLLIVTGSYTCDISRGNLPSVEALNERFGNRVDVMIVYTVEAHPFDSPSPYSATGDVMIAADNVRDNVRAAQPMTYGERVDLAKTWVREQNINVPLVIDNPRNEFWRAFGQAPNMAYLIDTEGKVAFRQLWFSEKEMKKQIRNLLHRPKY